MSFSVIIPARYGSSRLPGKPLLDLGGQPMIQRVWQRASDSGAERVIIATDDQRIADAAAGFGAECVLTRADHPSGTDRLQEVVATLKLSDDHIVVNVQGDEPLLPPAVIDQVAGNLTSAPDTDIATLAEPIRDSEQFFDPNAVKVVFDAHHRALYFSRAPIPWHRDAFAGAARDLPAQADSWRHVGIYAYRVSFLHRFVTWPPGRLEKIEMLEQLRAMENGVRIHVAPACESIPAGVDTEADLNRVRQLLEE